MEPNKLKQHFETEMKRAGIAILAFPWEDRAFYQNWCAQTYFYVNHSSRLIMLAGALFDHSKEKFHKRFMGYAKEEGGHEILALRDLKAMGTDPESVGEFATTKQFYGTQYKNIPESGSISFFGYILALEGTAIHWGASIMSKVTAAHGPRTASFLKVHAEEDIEHIHQAFKLLNGISSKEQDLIIEKFDQALAQYLTMLGECKLGSRREPKAS